MILPRSYPLTGCSVSAGGVEITNAWTSLPLTGTGVVDLIITNMGVLEVVPGGLKILELADGVSEAELRAATEATLV